MVITYFSRFQSPGPPSREEITNLLGYYACYETDALPASIIVLPREVKRCCYNRPVPGYTARRRSLRMDERVSERKVFSWCDLLTELACRKLAARTRSSRSLNDSAEQDKVVSGQSSCI